MTVSPVIQRLAAYIAQAPKKRLPPAVAEKTKHHVLDTIAAMVSGSRLRPGKKAIAFIRTRGLSIGGFPTAFTDHLIRQTFGTRFYPVPLAVMLPTAICSEMVASFRSTFPSPVMSPSATVVMISAPTRLGSLSSAGNPGIELP